MPKRSGEIATGMLGIRAKMAGWVWAGNGVVSTRSPQEWPKDCSYCENYCGERKNPRRSCERFRECLLGGEELVLLPHKSPIHLGGYLLKLRWKIRLTGGTFFPFQEVAEVPIGHKWN
jgi:hypothetical protein